MLMEQNKLTQSIVFYEKEHSIEAAKLLGAFEQLHANASVKVIDIAQLLQYSERTLRRKSRQYFDSSPIKLLQKIRLNRATLLLSDGMTSSQV